MVIFHFLGLDIIFLTDGLFTKNTAVKMQNKTDPEIKFKLLNLFSYSYCRPGVGCGRI